jgi:hypothetical protein
VEIPASARGGCRCEQEQQSLRKPRLGDNAGPPNPQHFFVRAIDFQASEKDFRGSFHERKQGQDNRRLDRHQEPDVSRGPISYVFITSTVKTDR